MHLSVQIVYLIVKIQKKIIKKIANVFPSEQCKCMSSLLVVKTYFLSPAPTVTGRFRVLNKDDVVTNIWELV